jgi:PatG C-terminal/Subtilase family
VNVLELVNLAPLMDRTEGRPEIKVGLIDGPVDLDHPGLESARVRELSSSRSTGCLRLDSAACVHGTFVAGILFGKRGSVAPAICPGCTLLIRPVFPEVTLGASQPATTFEALAEAILECVEAGAHVINLSLALTLPSPRGDQKLKEALDFAMKRDTLVVAASGNQGSVGGSALTRHRWVIPVSACDGRGRPLDESNLGNSVGQRGLRAPGYLVMSLGTAGQPYVAGGTSAAAAFVSGAAALLWSEYPDAQPSRIKLALTRGAATRRRTVVPALLNAWAAFQLMGTLHTSHSRITMDSNPLGATFDQPDTVSAQAAPDPERAPIRAVSRQTAGCGCGCGSGGAGTASDFYPFIYALGRINPPRFPSLAIEKELAQATGRAGTAGLSDSQALSAVLSKPENRYLARQMCWVFSVCGVETYLLRPRDPGDLQVLVEAVRPNPDPSDYDVVIGQRGPLAPPQMCNGLVLPVVVFEQLYSFDLASLVNSIPVPEKVPADKFSAQATDLFLRFLQIADNAGGTDEHRALNYLAVRYDKIYALVTEQFGFNRSLSAVDVQPSPLGGSRKIVEVIFSFIHRETDVVEKYFVRVDVTEQFPFLVSKLTPYYTR